MPVEDGHLVCVHVGAVAPGRLQSVMWFLVSWVEGQTQTPSSDFLEEADSECPPAARFPGMISGVTGIQSKRESPRSSLFAQLPCCLCCSFSLCFS